MAIGDAYVQAECDKCGEISEQVILTALTQRGSWDERSVRSRLRQMDWHIVGEQTLCPECAQFSETPKPEST